jgi:hypothetical protein
MVLSIEALCMCVYTFQCQYNSEVILDFVKGSFHFSCCTFVTLENIVRSSYDCIRKTIPEICHQQSNTVLQQTIPKTIFVSAV